MQSAILNLYGDVAQLGEPAQHNTCPTKTANCTNKSSENIQNNQIWACSAVGAHHIRIVGVVGSNPIRSTRKSRETISFTAFLQLFSQKCWARSSTVSALFPVPAPAPFASAIRDTRNDHYFSSPPLGKSKKKSGNE